MPTTELHHRDGVVVVEEIGDGRRRVVFAPSKRGAYVPYSVCVTRYPLALIKRMVELKGATWLCDEIRRDEDPEYVQGALIRAIESRVRPDELDGKRILDFGCGSGASSLIMGRRYPTLEVIGVELRGSNVALARQRAEFHGLQNVRFYVSPDAQSLPPHLGAFDFVLLSAVWEHLLPAERHRLAGLLWDLLAPEGILFVNQTPNRWSLIESHSTGLPLLNYLPEALAAWAANRVSKRLTAPLSRQELLRGGFRGGTEREIVDVLSGVSAQFRPVTVEPTRLGLKNGVDLWYASARHAHSERVARVARVAFALVKRASGIDVTPYLDLAVRKVPSAGRRARQPM